MIPARALEAGRNGRGRHLVSVPVKRRDGTGSDHHAKAGDELRGPEDTEQVIQRHVLQRLVPLYAHLVV